jgi:biotin synthase
MACLRLLRPRILMPTTSALENLRAGGQYEGLMAGANTVTLHDGSPEVEGDFVIYRSDRYAPRRALLDEVARAGLACAPGPLPDHPDGDGS